MTDAPAILIDHLSFRYPGAGDIVLRDVSLRVEEGERLGVLGPNGGGKSTLLKLMLGLLPVSNGRIELFGRSPEDARKLGLVGYLPQRIEAILDAPLSVLQVVRMPLMLGVGSWSHATAEDRSHIERVLKLLDLSELADRPVRALSGGQLQRVMIARALSRRPRVLVLDEPTVGIDVAGQQRFARLLSALQTELNLTLVVVSHELRTIVAGSSRIACLARTMHFHGSASGLTPKILAQVFQHDVEAVMGAVAGEHAHEDGACSADH